jgi:hypothetical protein
MQLFIDKLHYIKQVYNNKDLSKNRCTITKTYQMRLALMHEKLVTCTKRTPEPLKALSAAYLMKSGVEKEPHEDTGNHGEDGEAERSS